MFDRSDSLLLFCGLLVAGVVMLAADQGEGPRVEMSEAAAGLTSLSTELPLGAEPLQVDIPNKTVALGGGYDAKLMHSYVLSGRVVTRREYRHSNVADLSPLDLGIIWGDLLEPRYDNMLRYRTGKRMIRFQANPGADLPEDWETFVTNNHLIPASESIRTALMQIEVGQAVRLSGYLVSVTGNNLRPWTSSVRRDDGSIIGGCEIMLVTAVEVLPEAPQPGLQQARAGDG